MFLKKTLNEFASLVSIHFRFIHNGATAISFSILPSLSSLCIILLIQVFLEIRSRNESFYFSIPSSETLSRLIIFLSFSPILPFLDQLSIIGRDTRQLTGFRKKKSRSAPRPRKRRGRRRRRPWFRIESKSWWRQPRRRKWCRIWSPLIRPTRTTRRRTTRASLIIPKLGNGWWIEQRQGRARNFPISAVSYRGRVPPLQA